ncbi:hypothetical protein [Bacillus sp. JAS24-2]|uniref:hypothetical protein n=1 Tax=Bacillus sp. JAS24-2 TaxID=2217832 RepID=UPI0015D28585|nr:hypothetical protein [Bacillus sp. JAS24-2]
MRKVINIANVASDKPIFVEVVKKMIDSQYEYYVADIKVEVKYSICQMNEEDVS